MKPVAQFFKILADESRLHMLWLLFHHQELCVCDIMEALGITQSKASRHLATLRHAGLVVDRREAAWSYYSLRPAEDRLERAVLDTLRASLREHPGAATLLGNLDAWMARKVRGAACAPADARRPATKGTPARRRRAARSGGTR